MYRCPNCFKLWGDGSPSPAVPDSAYWVPCPGCESILDKHLSLMQSLFVAPKDGEMELSGGPQDGRRVPVKGRWTVAGFTDEGTPIVDTYEKLPGKDRAVYIGRSRMDGE